MPRWRLRQADDAEEPYTIAVDFHVSENNGEPIRRWWQISLRLASALLPLAFLLFCLFAAGFRL